MNNKLLIASLFLLSVTGCDSRSSEKALEKAKVSYSNQKYGESVVLLKNELLKDSANIDARLMLAKSQLKLGAYDAAIKDFEQLESRAGIEPSSLFPDYAEALYRTESYLALIEKTESKDDVGATALYYRALALTRVGDQDKASELITYLLAVDDNSVRNLAHATKLVAEGKLEDALALLDSSNFSEALSDEPFRLKAQILSALKRFEDSTSTLTLLTEQRPYDNPLKFFLALEFARNGEFSKANTIAESLLERAPNQPLLNQIKGYYLVKAGNLEDGLVYLEKAHQNGPKSDSLVMDMAQVAYQLEQNEKAYRYLKLVEYIPNKRVYDNLQLAISLRLGYSIESIPTMLAENSDSFNQDTMLAAGLALANQAKNDLSKQIYTDVKTKYPSNNTVELGLLGVQLGEMSALSILEQNYKEKKDANSRALYAASLIKLNELARAEKLAFEWVELNEDLAMGYQTLANIAIKRGDVQQVDINMQKLIEIEPNNRFANAYLAQKLAKSGNSEKALEIYSTLLELYPNDLNILASAYNHLKPLGEERDIVERVIKDKRTDNINSVPFYSSVLLMEQRHQDVVSMIEKFISKPELSDSAWNNYILALRAMGNLQASLTANQLWTKTKPNSIVAFMSLIVSYELTNEPKKALLAIENMERIFGQTIDTKLTRIYFLILDRQLVLAKSEFDLLSDYKDIDKIPFYKGLRGRLAYFSLDYASAVSDLREAYEKTRNEKTFKFLVSALKASGRSTEAIKVLKEYSDSRPGDLVSLLQLADLAAGFDSETEERAYVKILKISPKNIYASNNYAMLLLSKNNLALAKATIDNVLFENQLHPDLIDTAARIYHAQGDTVTANQLFEFLVQKTKGEYATYLFLKYLTETEQFELAEKIHSSSSLTFPNYNDEVDAMRSVW